MKRGKQEQMKKTTRDFSLPLSDSLRLCRATFCKFHLFRKSSRLETARWRFLASEQKGRKEILASRRRTSVVRCESAPQPTFSARAPTERGFIIVVTSHTTSTFQREKRRSCEKRKGSEISSWSNVESNVWLPP
jgi:hypothetical protein